MKTVMICEKEYRLEELNSVDLIIHYHTGRSVYLGGSGKNKQFGYRTGVQTNLGDIEISEWLNVVKQLIEFRGETERYNEFLLNVKNGFPWLKKEQEQIEYAMNLFLRKSITN